MRGRRPLRLDPASEELEKLRDQEARTFGFLLHTQEEWVWPTPAAVVALSPEVVAEADGSDARCGHPDRLQNLVPHAHHVVRRLDHGGGSGSPPKLRNRYSRTPLVDRAQAVAPPTAAGLSKGTLCAFCKSGSSREPKNCVGGRSAFAFSNAPGCGDERALVPELRRCKEPSPSRLSASPHVPSLKHDEQVASTSSASRAQRTSDSINATPSVHHECASSYRTPAPWSAGEPKSPQTCPPCFVSQSAQASPTASRWTWRDGCGQHLGGVGMNGSDVQSICSPLSTSQTDAIGMQSNNSSGGSPQDEFPRSHLAHEERLEELRGELLQLANSLRAVQFSKEYLISPQQVLSSESCRSSSSILDAARTTSTTSPSADDISRSTPRPSLPEKLREYVDPKTPAVALSKRPSVTPAPPRGACTFLPNNRSLQEMLSLTSSETSSMANRAQAGVAFCPKSRDGCRATSGSKSDVQLRGALQPARLNEAAASSASVPSGRVEGWSLLQHLPIGVAQAEAADAVAQAADATAAALAAVRQTRLNVRHTRDLGCNDLVVSEGVAAAAAAAAVRRVGEVLCAMVHAVSNARRDADFARANAKATEESLAKAVATAVAEVRADAAAMAAREAAAAEHREARAVEAATAEVLGSYGFGDASLRMSGAERAVRAAKSAAAVAQAAREGKAEAEAEAAMRMEAERRKLRDAFDAEIADLSQQVNNLDAQVERLRSERRTRWATSAAALLTAIGEKEHDARMREDELRIQAIAREEELRYDLAAAQAAVERAKEDMTAAIAQAVAQERAKAAAAAAAAAENHALAVDAAVAAARSRAARESREKADSEAAVDILVATSEIAVSECALEVALQEAVDAGKRVAAAEAKLEAAMVATAASTLEQTHELHRLRAKLEEQAVSAETAAADAQVALSEAVTAVRLKAAADRAAALQGAAAEAAARERDAVARAAIQAAQSARAAMAEEFDCERAALIASYEKRLSAAEAAQALSKEAVWRAREEAAALMAKEAEHGEARQKAEHEIRLSRVQTELAIAHAEEVRADADTVRAELALARAETIAAHMEAEANARKEASERVVSHLLAQELEVLEFEATAIHSSWQSALSQVAAATESSTHAAAIAAEDHKALSKELASALGRAEQAEARVDLIAPELHAATIATKTLARGLAEQDKLWETFSVGMLEELAAVACDAANAHSQLKMALEQATESAEACSRTAAIATADRQALSEELARALARAEQAEARIGMMAPELQAAIIAAESLRAVLAERDEHIERASVAVRAGEMVMMEELAVVEREATNARFELEMALEQATESAEASARTSAIATADRQALSEELARALARAEQAEARIGMMAPELQAAIIAAESLRAVLAERDEHIERASVAVRAGEMVMMEELAVVEREATNARFELEMALEQATESAEASARTSAIATADRQALSEELARALARAEQAEARIGMMAPELQAAIIAAESLRAVLAERDEHIERASVAVRAGEMVMMEELAVVEREATNARFELEMALEQATESAEASARTSAIATADRQALSEELARALARAEQAEARIGMMAPELQAATFAAESLRALLAERDEHLLKTSIATRASERVEAVERVILVEALKEQEDALVAEVSLAARELGYARAKMEQAEISARSMVVDGQVAALESAILSSSLTEQDENLGLLLEAVRAIDMDSKGERAALTTSLKDHDEDRQVLQQRLACAARQACGAEDDAQALCSLLQRAQSTHTVAINLVDACMRGLVDAYSDADSKQRLAATIPRGTADVREAQTNIDILRATVACLEDELSACYTAAATAHSEGRAAAQAEVEMEHLATAVVAQRNAMAALRVQSELTEAVSEMQARLARYEAEGLFMETQASAAHASTRVTEADATALLADSEATPNKSSSTCTPSVSKGQTVGIHVADVSTSYANSVLIDRSYETSLSDGPNVKVLGVMSSCTDEPLRKEDNEEPHMVMTRRQDSANEEAIPASPGTLIAFPSPTRMAYEGYTDLWMGEESVSPIPMHLLDSSVDAGIWKSRVQDGSATPVGLPALVAMRPLSLVAAAALSPELSTQASLSGTPPASYHTPFGSPLQRANAHDGVLSPSRSPVSRLSFASPSRQNDSVTCPGGLMPGL